jgi:hypothetical protein
MLAHYHTVADPCRVGDPHRKGTVENAIQHTQGTALKGRRFDSAHFGDRDRRVRDRDRWGPVGRVARFSV